MRPSAADLSIKDLLKLGQKALEQTQQQSILHIWEEEDSTRVYDSDPKKIKLYRPTPTIKKFHEDDSFVRLIIGPYGSGKSTGCDHEIIKRARAMPVWHNGRRRSRWAIVRNTSGELQSTTLQTWLMWFDELGDIQKRQKPLMTYEHTFRDDQGVVELELLFIALDREEDIRKIKSLEVTGVYINELSEVPQGAIAHFKGRLNGRYPSKQFCSEPYWSGIIADTNAPDEDHWIKSTFEDAGLEDYKLFRQPPGLIKCETNIIEPGTGYILHTAGEWIHNPACDNSDTYAPKYDYYTKMAQGQNEDFIKVFCLGEYGLVAFGRRVFPEYNPDVHSMQSLQVMQQLPIDLSFDFGLTPTCLVTQLSPRGQLLVLKEYTSSNMGIRTFAQSVVIPSLSKEFPNNKIGSSVADPAGIAGDQIMEELSCIGELNSLGIVTNPARTNDLEPRLGSVRWFLNTMIDGKPCFVLSREGCPMLHKGLAKEYVYKRLAIGGEERYRDIPDKNAVSHPADCLQYRCMEHAPDLIARDKMPVKKVEMYNPVMRVF